MWRGPAKVIGQDGSKVLIKIPTGLISVHSCNVGLTSNTEVNRIKAEQMEIKESNEEPVVQPTTLSDDDDYLTMIRAEEADEVDDDAEPVPPVVDADPPVPAVNIENNNTKHLPKLQQCVQFKIPDSDEWKNVKVIGRAGKATGKYKSWLNIKDLDAGVESPIDWDTVAEWRPIPHQVFHSSVKARNDHKFEEARKKELESWKSLQVYEEVEDKGQKAISTRWVYTEKVVNSATIKKARLVARGFEEQNEYIQTDSPTCNKESLRIALAIISSNDWEINSLDVKTAFLQGKELERDVYLKPPREAQVPGKLWRLNRCVYGLNDASRYWYFKIRD